MNEKGEFKEIKEYQIKQDEVIIMTPSIVDCPPTPSAFLKGKMQKNFKLRSN